MPVVEIAGELIGGVLRFFGQIFAEIIFEFLIKGAGYTACRLVKKDANPDGVLVVFVGVFFWLLVICLGVIAYSFVMQ